MLNILLFEFSVSTKVLFFASFPFDCAIKTRANFVTAAKEQCHVVRMSLFKNWHLGFSATAHDIDAQPSRQSILRSFRAQTRVAMVTIELRCGGWQVAARRITVTSIWQASSDPFSAACHRGNRASHFELSPDDAMKS